MSRRTAVVLLLGTFAILAIVLTTMWVRGLDAGYLCGRGLEPAPIDHLPVDVIPEGGGGSWSWWPTGITCSFPTENGGRFLVHPNSSLSAVLVAAVVTGSAGVALLLAPALFVSKRSRRS